MRNDILSKSSEKMAAVVKKLAEEKGLDLVVDTQAALYFKPTLNLTAEATAAYDNAGKHHGVHEAADQRVLVFAVLGQGPFGCLTSAGHRFVKSLKG